jgi:serine/threonine protein kinase/Tfp pilus assembly protein PilF
MTPERWEQVKALCGEALGRPTAERATYLAAACGADLDLRHEVDTLLAETSEGSGYLVSHVELALPPGESELLAGPRDPGQLLGPYRIERLLGRGGMGEVYRAYDSRLSRYVAIKVLRADADEDQTRLHRLLKEARAVANLNHPNIVAIHDVGTAGQTSFLVHELLEGQTLRDVLAAGAVSVERAIDYGLQIASGLAAAHDAGIIHRDLKPANIFVTSDGRVKILDFGLAKVTERAPSDRFASESAAGIVVGTVGYMSPEQLRGEAVDHRTDIFSFGVILYEMLTGDRAFKKGGLIDKGGDFSAQLPDLPVDLLLAELVHKCLRKNVEARIQSCGDVHFLLNLALRRTERQQRDLPAVTRLAILPVVTASPLEHDLSRCVSATDALVLELVRLPDVRVISSASIVECQRRQLSLRALADAVGADLIVNVSMSCDAASVRFSMTLLDPLDRIVWSDQVSGPESDFVTVQRAMSETVRSYIGARLRIQTNVASRSTVNVSRLAHEHYLKGLHHWHKHTAGSWAKAADWFKRSTVVDPSFAPAFAGLARSTYSLAALRGTIALGEYLTIKDATARALALDPNLADAHAIDARVKWTPEWNIDDAGVAFERSLALNPSSSEVNNWYAIYLVTIGRRAEGLHYARAAVQCDPVSVAAQIRLAVVLHNAGLYGEAIAALEYALDLEPGLVTAQANLGCAHVAAGQPEIGVQLLKAAAAGGDPVIISELVWALARCGQQQEAEQVFQRLPERPGIPAVCLAWCHANLGRKDDAFNWLDAAIRERSLELIGLNVDRMFDAIRDDPRFSRALSTVGLSRSPATLG